MKKHHDGVGTFYECCALCGETMTLKDGRRALCAECWEKERKIYERPNNWKRKYPDSS